MKNTWQLRNQDSWRNNMNIPTVCKYCSKKSDDRTVSDTKGKEENCKICTVVCE